MLFEDAAHVTIGVNAITTRFVLAEPALPRFATWQAELSRAAAAAEGFVSIEIIPTYAGSLEWQAVQRFGSGAALQAWRVGGERARCFSRLVPMLSPEHRQVIEEAAPDFHATSFVTEVITTSVHPGGEREYQVFAEAMQATQASFPGYMGTLIQAPVSSELSYWTTLVRFATPAQLDAWLTSEDRKVLLARADARASTWKGRRMQSGFAAWFPSTEADTPPAWKQTMLVLLVLFPVVMLEIRFLSPHLAAWPSAIATFVGNALSVALVSWPLMSFAVAGLSWWLKPAPEQRAQREVLGLATVLGLYAIEIAFFMYLFTL